MADFATVAELEAFMGTTSLGARGTAILGYASAAIRREVGQDIEATDGRQEEWAAMPTRRSFSVSQVPVRAVTSVTVDAVAFTGFTWDRWTGTLTKDDGSTWADGPIVVTYDSGYAAGSDEMIAAKTICLEVASRALAPGAAAFESLGPEVGELRGGPVAIFLTEEERRELQGLSAMALA